MHRYVCFNQEITDASKIHLPAVSSAAFYGRGIFTTVAIYDSKPFQWSKHWQRLTENAEAIGVNLSEIPENQVVSALSELVNANKVNSGRARITIFDRSSGGIWQNQNKLPNAFLITSADFRRLPNDLGLTVSPYPVNSKSLLAGVKSCNYLENILALDEAQKRGFDEAIRLNEKGEAVSATMANIFWTQGEEIFTSALETGALDGTTRAFVLENFRVCEKKASLNELKKSDEIFLTSAGLGIARVANLEKRSFKRSDVFSRLCNFFDEFTFRKSLKSE